MVVYKQTYSHSRLSTIHLSPHNPPSPYTHTPHTPIHLELIAARGLQALLDEAAAVLVAAKLHHVADKVPQLLVGAIGVIGDEQWVSTWRVRGQLK